MKIYIATPVNGRKEKTMREKTNEAFRRVRLMGSYLLNFHNDAEFVSVFNIAPPATLKDCSEQYIMGRCIEMVIDCDMIVLDDGWESSRGCTIERYVAMQYGKQIRTINWFKLQDVLTKVMDKAKEL